MTQNDNTDDPLGKIKETLPDEREHTLSNEVERRPPTAGGCWFCKTGNGFEDDDMAFDSEFDAFAHTECLEANDVESIYEFEMGGSR